MSGKWKGYRMSGRQNSSSQIVDSSSTKNGYTIGKHIKQHKNNWFDYKQTTWLLTETFKSVLIYL